MTSRGLLHDHDRAPRAVLLRTKDVAVDVIADVEDLVSRRSERAVDVEESFFCVVFGRRFGDGRSRCRSDVARTSLRVGLSRHRHHARRTLVRRRSGMMLGRTVGWLAATLGLASGAWLGCGGSAGNADLVAPAEDAGADAASNDGASGGGDASSGGDGAAPAPRGGDGGVNPPDAGPGGSVDQIACGATSCAIPAQTCCVTRTNGGAAYGCVSGTSCAPSGGGGGGAGTALKCSASANCPAGRVCCVRQVNNGAASDCQTVCGNKEAQLCDPAAAATGCAPGASCSSKNIGDWGLPATYATCGGVGN
jgi:hypothetical protein